MRPLRGRPPRKTRATRDPVLKRWAKIMRPLCGRPPQDPCDPRPSVSTLG